MGLSTIHILGVSVTADSKQKILEYIKKYLVHSIRFTGNHKQKSVKPFVIATPNPEQVVLAQSDKRFRDILNQADVALPDGIGLVLTDRFSRYFSSSIAHTPPLIRISGVEFMEDLVKTFSNEGVRMGLIGGTHGVALKALECLRNKYPKLDGWAMEAPAIDTDKPEAFGRLAQSAARKITETDTRIVFIGLGAPKQEYFIEVLSKLFTGDSGGKQGGGKSVNRELLTMHYPVFMSVGGSFDILSGRLKRAPVFIRSIGFEWLWRLFQEPWRWRRQVVLGKFIVLVIRSLYSIKR